MRSLLIMAVLTAAAVMAQTTPTRSECDSESEPPLQDGYVDNFNGGCDSPQYVFGGYGPPFTYLFDCLNGTSGWYQANGSSVRDTDWYEFVDVASGHVTFTLEAEQPSILRWLIRPFDCSDVQVVQSVLAEPGFPASITVDVGPGGCCLMWVGPTTTEPPAGFVGHEYDWQLNWTVFGSYLPVPLSLRERERPDSRMIGGWCQVGQHIGSLLDDFSSDRVCGGPATPGPDGLLAVYLEDGETLEIDNWWIAYPAGEGRTDMITYTLLTDLREVHGACAGVHETNNRYYHTFDFVAETTGWHYLVVDCLAAEANPEIRFTTHHPATPPPPPPAHDACDGALILAPGPLDLADDLTAATNDFDPGESGTYGRWRTGRDVVYRFEAGHGANLDVTMTGAGDWDEELYVVADCANPTTTCLAVGAADDAGGVRLNFTAPAAGTYWLVCDSFGVGARPFTLTGALGTVSAVPQAGGLVVLEPCQPNPFNPRTTVAFRLPDAMSCQLAIYGLDGRRLRALLDETRGAGRHEVTWDGRNDAGARVPSGLYFARLAAGGEVRTVKLAMVQ